MEIRYQRELKHNYLILQPEEMEEDFYELHMLEENRIEGLLKMHVKHLETGCLYYYEITSRQPLSRLLENRGMKGEELKQLILGIGNIIERMEVFLLKEENIWLTPDHIYIEPEGYEVYLCLVPGMKNDFPQSVKQLLQYLLGKLDHKDREGVVLAYGLFQESQKENYGIKDLLKVIGSAGEKEKEEKREKPGLEEEKQWEEKEEPIRKVSPLPEIKERREGDLSWKKYCFYGGGILLIGIFLYIGWFLLTEEIINWKAAAAGTAVFGIGAAVFMILQGAGQKEENEEGEKIEEKKKPKERHSSDCWIMELEEEEEKEEERKREEKAEEAEKIFPSGDTALLADLAEKDTKRRLVSLDKNGQEISVTYYPFLIGKQEGLVDYVLDFDTVSRLHLRIDEEDGKYRITDLNSTNGTSIRGRMLEANESAEIQPGDSLYIADRGFLFI